MTARRIAHQLWYHGVFQIATTAVAVIIAGIAVILVS